MLELKQSTAISVPVGPTVSTADGSTLISSMTVASVTCGLIKGVSGSAVTLTASGGNNDLAVIANNTGYWSLELTAGDLGTLGMLRVTFQYETIFLPFFEDYMVLTAAEWDRKYSTGATVQSVYDQTVGVAQASLLATVDTVVDGIAANGAQASLLVVVDTVVDGIAANGAQASLLVVVDTVVDGIAANTAQASLLAVVDTVVDGIALNGAQASLLAVVDTVVDGIAGGGVAGVAQASLLAVVDTVVDQLAQASALSVVNTLVGALAQASLLAVVDTVVDGIASSVEGVAQASLLAVVDTVADGIASSVAGVAQASLLSVVDTVVDGIAANGSQASLLAVVDTVVDGIKVKTDLLPDGIKKNMARAGFMFCVYASSDHVTPKTGLGSSITAQRSLDAGAFGSCANAANEIGEGVYTIDLAAADLNADMVMLKFTAAATDPRYLLVVTNE